MLLPVLLVVYSLRRVDAQLLEVSLVDGTGREVFAFDASICVLAAFECGRDRRIHRHAARIFVRLHTPHLVRHAKAGAATRREKGSRVSYSQVGLSFLAFSLPSAVGWFPCLVVLIGSPKRQMQ